LLFTEINISKLIGLIKEVIVDRSLAGHLLPDNIIVIAACNPVRPRIQRSGTRELDLGRDWSSGHYQVVPLPPSLNKMKWSLGSLRPEQEKEFIYRRLNTLECMSMPSWLQVSMTEIISASHEAIRQFASENILASMCPNKINSSEGSMLEEEARTRAKSVVSLRDIQRIFSLYEFLYRDRELDLERSDVTDNTHHRRSMLVAIAVVYFIRLDSKSRERFVSLLSNLRTEKEQVESFLEVFNESMDLVLGETEIPAGIAATKGLKENIFITLVCAMSRTPLMIIGPPGSSKVSY
jgi:hypothetical protein